MPYFLGSHAHLASTELPSSQPWFWLTQLSRAIKALLLKCSTSCSSQAVDHKETINKCFRAPSNPSCWNFYMLLVAGSGICRQWSMLLMHVLLVYSNYQILIIPIYRAATWLAIWVVFSKLCR